MSLNASIIEQRVAKLVETRRSDLGSGNDDQLRTKAFVWLATSTVNEVSRFLPYSTHAVAMFVGEELLGGVSPERLQSGHGALLAAFRESAPEYYWRGLLKVRLLLLLEGLDDQRASLQRLAGAFRRGDLLEKVGLVLEMTSDVYEKMQPGLDELDQIIASCQPPQAVLLSEPLLALIEANDAFVALVEELRSATQRGVVSSKSTKTGKLAPLEARAKEVLIRVAALRASTHDH